VKIKKGELPMANCQWLGKVLILILFLLSPFAIRLSPSYAATCPFPGSLATFLQFTEGAGWVIRAEIEDAGAKSVSYNRLSNCVEALIAELGVLPKGSYATVVARLNDAVYFTPTRTANTVLGGPASGAADGPTFRALVADDIPSLGASKITTELLALARGGTNADLSGTGAATYFLRQASAGANVTVGPLVTADLPAVVIDVLSKLDNSLCADGEVPKKAAGAWSCQTDATGGSPTRNSVLNPVANVAATMGANSETITFDSSAGVMAYRFTSAFTTGPQFLLQQVTGNPTGGILAEFRAADADVIAWQAGNGTDGVQVTQPGILQVVGAGHIVADRTICNAGNPLLRYDGACTSASGASWDTIGSPAASQNLTMAANSTLWTFNNTAGKFQADFTSAFASGSQWLIQQLTGNPTGGVLFEIKVGDTDVTAARIGDGTNYLNISKTGVTSAVGSATIAATTSATATALAANGANCSAGQAPLGVDAAGAAEGCFAVSTTSSTDTFTNKTLDAEGTGNVLSVPVKIWLPAAGCNNATAGPIWDLPAATPAAAACVTGTNIQKGVLDYADTAGGFSAQITQSLPVDWTTTGGLDIVLYWTTTATSGNAKWSVSTICTDVAASATDNPAFNTANTVTTAAPGTTNQVQTSAIAGLTTTGCTTATKMLLHLKVFRAGDDAADTIAATARLIGAELTFRRAM
jgi:hypothetical protein